MNYTVEEKSFQFAARIVNVYKYMTGNKKEYILSKQLLRCGTSIGANVSEAQQGQSRADFIAKLSIALKEDTKPIIGFACCMLRTIFLMLSFHLSCKISRN